MRGESSNEAPARGLQLITDYKIARGVIAWVACILLLVLSARGQIEQIHDAAVSMRANVTHTAVLKLARFLAEITSVPKVNVAAMALALDGAFSFFEAWALRRRFWWAPWLVLISTGSLLVVEIILLAHGIKLGRAV